MLITLFRIIAIVEGISYLLLLGIAMPLKYLADSPGAVRVTGLIHGVLFIAFCVLLIPAMRKLSLGYKAAFWGFISSLIPFGTFVLDGYVKKRVLMLAQTEQMRGVPEAPGEPDTHGAPEAHREPDTHGAPMTPGD